MLSEFLSIPKNIRELTAALNTQAAQLTTLGKRLNETVEQRESAVVLQQKAGEDLAALVQHLDRRRESEAIVQAIQENTQHVSTMGRVLERTSSCPLPVQTFPVVDNFAWEQEKQAAAKLAVQAFSQIQAKSIASLSGAHQQVNQAFEKFFSLLDDYGMKVDRSKSEVLNAALDQLIACSPKRVVGNFQQYSLEIGWAYVSKYNDLVDTLAQAFPRCRAGIYAARLNYADVLQISEEVLATLRATSTVLEDIQRRYDLLEGLQNELKADLESAEISKIFEALKGCFSDIYKVDTQDDGWWTSFWKKTGGATAGSVAAVLALMSVPNAQFQGQLSREQRIRVFIATSAMVRQGWEEWSRLNQQVVAPNLKVMFALKNDFAANRILCLCDLVTTNGYELGKLVSQLKSGIEARPKQLPV